MCQGVRLRFALTGLCLVGAGAPVLADSPPQAAAPVQVFAAGSLRPAMLDLVRAFEAAQPGVGKVQLTTGASGLLKGRIEAGEAAEVFASANMEHPDALLRAGRAERVQPFAANALCALASPGFTLQGKTLAARLLDAEVRVGISTPKADPAGDYAFQMFDRIETSGAGPLGSAQQLKAKALPLTGGPLSPPPPPDRNVYGALMAQGQADVFFTYCTNTAIARREEPTLQVLPLPDAIQVSALYGVALLKPVMPGAQAFIDFVMSPAGQGLLAAHGFSAPTRR